MKMPLTHAKSKNGEIKYVLDVPNGNACNCVCPICNEALTAKHGNKDVNIRGHIPHFAHQSGKEMCEGAQMSVMHLKAQQIIIDRGLVMAPRYRGIKERVLKFVSAKPEERKEWCGIRPDVFGVSEDGKKWAVEIYYTNKVDRIKEEKIKEHNLSCFEIDITGQTFDSLENFLLNSADSRWWINNPNYDEIIKEEERKRAEAEKQRIEAERLKKEADRLKVFEVTHVLLNKEVIRLPEYSCLPSKIIRPIKRALYSSTDKLYSVVELTVKEDDNEQNYYICVGTSNSIRQYLKEYKRNVLELDIYNLHKDNFLFDGDYNYKWRYNVEYEQQIKQRNEQRIMYQQYYSRPDKWYVKPCGQLFSLKCEINEDCNLCEFFERFLEYEGERYAVCNLEKKKAFERSKVEVEKQITLTEPEKTESLLPSFIEERNFSVPMGCDSIIEVGDYYQKNGIVNWSGGVDHMVDKLKVLEDGEYLIMIHHKDSVYYLTEFSKQKYNLLARTKISTREMVLKVFDEIK